ncbi:MAG TPA: MBL fold metallo-hydrolase [Candidatus Paceibacterota bacterium]
MDDDVKVKFWGVRGSIAAPLTAKDVREKQAQIVFKILEHYHRGIIPGHLSPEQLLALSPEQIIELFEKNTPATYGGNTSCVAVRFNDQIVILDMGTGLRPLGDSLFPEMFKQKGLKGTFLLSHVHWDHIQGLPFFAELYSNKELVDIKNELFFLGGTDWQKTAESCIAGQMDPPNFPVAWSKIKKMTYKIGFDDMHDGKKLTIGESDVTCRFRVLDHPQETYGTRMEFPSGKVIAYTTDNEPRDPLFPAEPLLWLAKGAKIWITDCQYTKGQYEGAKNEGGVSRQGWGHSYPEAVAVVAVKAGVEQVVLFHHDPNSSDEKIAQMVVHTQNLINEMGGTSKVIAAWEGLELSL